jgi:hypothetical protein
LIILWQSYYVAVGRGIFRVAPEDYILIDEGMFVKVVHFPHTLQVVSIHVTKDESRATPSDHPPTP